MFAAYKFIKQELFVDNVNILLCFCLQRVFETLELYMSSDFVNIISVTKSTIRKTHLKLESKHEELQANTIVVEGNNFAQLPKEFKK